MKKIILVLSLVSLVFLTSCKKDETKNDTQTDSKISVENTGEGSTNSFGGMVVGDDIINENARYVYFYSKTCSHCKELNAYFEKNDTFNKAPIAKLEVTENIKNQNDFRNLLTELGAETAGVPFIYDTVAKKYVVGTPDSIALIEAYTPETPKTEEVKSEETSKDTKEEMKEEVKNDENVENKETQENSEKTENNKE